MYRDVSALPGHIFDEIKHFFEVYKNLEGKETCVDSVQGRDFAVKSIAKDLKRYEEAVENGTIKVE